MAPRAKTYDERNPPAESGDMLSSTETEDKKRPDIPGEQLLTREQVATKLGISARGVYDLEKKGILPPPVRLGGIWVRHPASIIEAHIAELMRKAKG
jgi:predicted DNA-binding transcriptional regulator AlpA